MQRSIAFGLVASGVGLAAVVLLAAIPTVLTRPGARNGALGDAQAAAMAAIDAPRPETPRPDAAAPSSSSASSSQSPAKRAILATPAWIWAPERAADAADATATLARAFTLDAAARDARVVVAADNAARVLLDGRELGTTDDWASPREFAVDSLASGAHEVVIEARNEGGPAGVCAIIEWTDAAGARQRLATDGAWKVRGGGKPGERDAKIIAKLGDGPWGDSASQAFGGSVGDIDRAIAVPPGFVCELVYSVPKTRGSVVALTPDSRGRIVASAQYGPLFAITPCGPGGDPASTKVEPIEPTTGFAHGLLAVDNDLFVVVSEGGPDKRGLYRLRDTDRNGSYDEKKQLGAFDRDGGEHGPHQVVLAPDGSIWVVGGNHCAPPAEAFEHARLPHLWQEDIIFSRIWDPNGHAVGIMAPGGWVVRTDRDGSKWELVTAGFRNSFDLAFDEVGRAFTYDSDMEWDMGLPWYRPTRVCELASGVDYGWRSGSGKWPAWSPDSLPPAVDVGPASPTGVLSSQGLQFPAPWNDCMFFLDWTYGTMWAGWTTDDSKDASTPKMRIEPFLAGRPLPLTDAVTMNGEMYFAVGGRNLPSAIYRVRAENPIAVKRAPMQPPAALVERREIEKLHERLSGAAAQSAVERAFAALSSKDAGVRSAARIAIEHQDPAIWRARAVASAAAQPSILALVAICRAGDAALDGGPVAARLVALEPEVRGTPLEREWLRACELWHLRFASKSAGAIAGDELLKKAVLANFPAKDGEGAAELDAHRAAWLAKIGAPEAVVVTVALLEKPDLREAPKIGKGVDAALLARGGPYGRAVQEMLANAPATQKIALVHAMRDAKNGWTPDLRIRFARAVADLRRASGGNSFAGFLNRMSEDFVANAPQADRDFLARTAAGNQSDEAPVIARGPGHQWTVDEIVALTPKFIAGRDHAEGLRAYRAAQCAQCHRVGSVGGSGGPELTGVSRRFSPEDLASSLVDPSKTVSDQYQNADIVLKNGKTVTGRIVSDSTDAIEVRTSLLSDAREKIAKSDIASRAPSKVSPMPAHLLDGLSEGELLDLMAFLRSGGDAADPAFMRIDDDGFLQVAASSQAAATDARAMLAPFSYDPKFWSVEQGEIVGRTSAANPAPHNTFLVWNGEVRDFELEVEMKVMGNNSGVQYRSELFGPNRLRGPQIDSHPNPPYVAMFYEEGGRGILAERGNKLEIAADGKRTSTPLAGEPQPAPDISKWHTYRIVAKGNTMRHFLDGKPTAVVVDDSPERPKGGSFGVQIHAGEPMEVRVRSIRMKRFDG